MATDHDVRKTINDEKSLMKRLSTFDSPSLGATMRNNFWGALTNSKREKVIDEIMTRNSLGTMQKSKEVGDISVTTDSRQESSHNEQEQLPNAIIGAP